MQERWVQSQGRQDPLEEEMLTHSVLLPGKFLAQRNLVGYSPWGGKESGVTEVTQQNTAHTSVVYVSPSLPIHPTAQHSISCPTPPRYWPGAPRIHRPPCPLKPSLSLSRSLMLKRKWRKESRRILRAPLCWSGGWWSSRCSFLASGTQCYSGQTPLCILRSTDSNKQPTKPSRIAG